MQAQPEHTMETANVSILNESSNDLSRRDEVVINAANHDFDRPLSRYIWVTFQKEGIHRYPQAGSDLRLEDVQFLAFPHRHIFHFRVEIQVEHNDRDIEFIQFKRWCESLFSDGTLELDYQSCEMLAENLMRVINNRYPGRELEVSVAEDNENGATLRLQ
jgi:hypothetical protein